MSASTSAASPPRRCCATPSSRTSSTHEKDKFGITGDASMDFKPTHARSREVSDSHRQGRPLPDEEEQDRGDRRLGHLHRRQDDRGRSSRTARPARSPPTTSSSPPAPPPGWCPGTELSENVVTYEEQILTDQLPGSIVIAGSGAIGVEFAYVMANFGVDVTIVEFLDRMVPTEDAEVSKELAKHYKKLGVKVLLKTKVEKHRGHRRQGQGHRQQGRQGGGHRDRQGPPGDRLRAAARGLRPRQDRRGDDRPRRDRGRRARPHQRRRRLRDRRRHRQADARPHRRGDGHRRRRDDRRRTRPSRSTST